MRDMIEHVSSPGSNLRRLLPGVTSEDFRQSNYASWILLTLGLWLDTHEVAA